MFFQFTGGNDNYLITGGGHPFLSAEVSELLNTHQHCRAIWDIFPCPTLWIIMIISYVLAVHWCFIHNSYLFFPIQHTFHTPSLGDEVFEIPPIPLDPDSALTVGDVVSHFGELSEGTGGPSGSRGLVNNPVVGANDPSFASTYVTSGTQGLEHLSLAVMSQAGGGALLSSSALVSVCACQTLNGYFAKAVIYITD